MASDFQSFRINLIFDFSERVLTLWGIFQFRNTQFERLEHTLAINFVFIGRLHKLNTFVLLKFFKVRLFKEDSGELQKVMVHFKVLESKWLEPLLNQGFVLSAKTGYFENSGSWQRTWIKAFGHILVEFN
jgi:hypothetical protein